MRNRRRQSGFTLMELLLVSIIVSILAGISFEASKFLTSSTFALQDRTRAVSDLYLVLEYVRQDLGAAETVVPTLEGGLQIYRDEAFSRRVGAWKQGADLGIRYSLDDESLIRHDFAGGTAIVVALGITEFQVDEPSKDITRIFVTAGDDAVAQAATLIWEP